MTGHKAHVEVKIIELVDSFGIGDKVNPEETEHKEISLAAVSSWIYTYFTEF